MSDKPVLPKAPQNEGVDPLTNGRAYKDGENIKGKSTFNKAQNDDGESTPDEKSAELTAEQQEVDAKANTPDSQLPDQDKTVPENAPDETPEQGQAAPADNAGTAE